MGLLMAGLRFSDDWLEVLRAARDGREITVGCSDEGCGVDETGVPDASSFRVVDMGDHIDMAIDCGSAVIWADSAVVRMPRARSETAKLVLVHNATVEDRLRYVRMLLGALPGRSEGESWIDDAIQLAHMVACDAGEAAIRGATSALCGSAPTSYILDIGRQH